MKLGKNDLAPDLHFPSLSVCHVFDESVNGALKAFRHFRRLEVSSIQGSDNKENSSRFPLEEVPMRGFYVFHMREKVFWDYWRLLVLL